MSVLLVLQGMRAGGGDGKAPLPDATRWELAPEPARMSPRELRVLPGIGERLSRAIADARHERPGLGWEDVVGIGPRTAERLRVWLASHGLGTELRAPGARGNGAAERPPPDEPGDVGAATLERESRALDAAGEEGAP